MTDRKLLEKAIQESGLKKSYIAQALGMSRPTFNAYMAGSQEFRVTHMNILCALLRIDSEQREAIFFDSSGAL